VNLTSLSRSSLRVISIVLLQVAVLYQPSIDHFPFKSPLVTNFEGGDLFLANQTVDRESINLQVTGYLLGC